MADEWPAELDAVAAAPGFHAILLEGDDVRVLDTRVGPGEAVPLHTHRWPAVLYVLSFADFVRRDAAGEVVVDTRAAGIALEPGSALMSPPLPPHTLENVGATELHVLSVELMRAG